MLPQIHHCPNSYYGITLTGTMDPADPTIDVASLSETFKTAVECFERVELGANFRDFFDASQLKLSLAQNRLCRWGKTLGIDKMDEASFKNDFANVSLGSVNSTLERILSKFKETQDLCDEYRKMISHDDGKPLHACIRDLEMSREALKLDIKMRMLAISPGQRRSLRIRWVLYDGRLFTQLLANITIIVTDLENMFPHLEAKRADLCKNEAAQLIADTDGDKAITLLKEIAKQQDKVMYNALSMERSESSGNTATSSRGNNHAIQAGSNDSSIGGHSNDTSGRDD
ncbi:hypothetical protein BT63DRAFT_412611 [Microthyrium microscopicum]|uniref:Prion-inhibition and propagation HeLo domain-containing protein n=1 Tax=Microthyrium microscopicum TaxID=703497 RepID=A0A6A6UD75_9PEZI|nr:hypothetical protein BT63DRAFT_412611 [Microthyrium microscopicum]